MFDAKLFPRRLVKLNQVKEGRSVRIYLGSEEGILRGSVHVLNVGQRVEHDDGTGHGIQNLVRRLLQIPDLPAFQLNLVG